jgi:nucleotide-binding universal stress UspA family protein
MTTATTILIPMDGSAAALRALRHVVKSRRRTPLRLAVVNVQGELLPSTYINKRMIAEYQASRAEAALAPARALAAKLKLEAEFYARTGDAGEEIVALATKTGADEIVMGTRGLSRLSGLLMGSTATRVVQLARVPVTLVK